MVKNITVKEFKRLSNINIIDIRNKEKYLYSHIDGSINIGYDELINNTNKYLNKSEEYYIYCDSGKKSLSICFILNSKGYKLINIIGGYSEWINTFGRR